MSKEDKKDEQKDEQQEQQITPEMFNALQDSVSALEAKNKELKDEKSRAKAEAEKVAQESARKAGDVEALEKSWQEKLANETKERDERLTEYQQMVNRMTAGAEAQKMASELAVQGSADVLLPHIANRLTVELANGEPKVRVLDGTGKPSALTLDDLKKEISDNKSFAPLLVGSKASGSGDVGKGGKGGGDTTNRSAFAAMNPHEQMTFIKSGGKVVDE